MTFATTARLPGRTSWTPATEGGLLAWYRVGDLSLSDGDSVTSWADQSGNSRTLSGYTGTAPLYKTGITPGGQPVVRFSAGNLATSPLATDGTSSLFIFTQVTNQSLTRMLIYHGNSAATGYGIYQPGTTGLAGLFGGVAAFGSISHSTDFRSLGVLVNSSNPRGTLLVNDSSAGTTNSANGSGSDYGIQVGGFDTGQYIGADVCEVVYFDHVIDSTARTNLQDYFEAKYL
jgi:hypothetical protein